MSEQLPNHNDEQSAEPDWNRVFERIDIIGFSEDVHARADDVARNFTTGKDIEMFGKAIHDIVVPDIESMPVDYAVKVGGRELAQPGEREAMYKQAAAYIAELNAMRQTPADDEEFLRRVSSVVGLTAVGTHSYANGNGRTSRVMAELIRNGSSERDDLKIYGTERDISEKQLNGLRIYSFMPTYESRDAGVTIDETIAAAASTDIPLDQREAYLKRGQDMFITPYGYGGSV